TAPRSTWPSRGARTGARTAPGSPETRLHESGLHGRSELVAVVGRFVLHWGNVPKGLEEAAVVEPVDPGERGELDLLRMPPRPLRPDDLGLVEADHRFGQGIVVGVADAANRGLDAGRSEPLGVANRQVLLGFNRSSQHGFYVPSQLNLGAPL